MLSHPLPLVRPMDGQTRNWKGSYFKIKNKTKNKNENENEKSTAGIDSGRDRGGGEEGPLAPSSRGLGVHVRT
jgi:hypothetical protein